MSDTIDTLNDILSQGISEKLYTGAQLVVCEKGKFLTSHAVGKTRALSTPNDVNCLSRAININTLFDVASLTKPIATTSLMMKACDDKIFSLSDKLITVSGLNFPAWLLPYKIEDLLSHQTPLQAWHDFHGSLPRYEDHETAMRYFERQIMTFSPRADDQSWCYSDIGFILLGFMLELAYEKPLSELFDAQIATPIGLRDKLTYTPLHRFNRETIPATCHYQEAYIQGHPDDANARALTHIAGHAGLFASAEGIAEFVTHLLSGNFPCKTKTIQHFLTYKSNKTPFALGWDRPTSEDSLSGRKPGENVIGHLGFTGCSVWIDLDTHRSVTLLTNRTHVNDEPKSLAKLRREIHSICWNL